MNSKIGKCVNFQIPFILFLFLLYTIHFPYFTENCQECNQLALKSNCGHTLHLVDAEEYILSRTKFLCPTCKYVKLYIYSRYYYDYYYLAPISNPLNFFITNSQEDPELTELVNNTEFWMDFLRYCM